MSLTKFQQDIVDECLEKGKGGLSLPMGSGKTLISLTLALNAYERYKEPALVIMAKTLIPSWITEINKFFGTSLKYKILHSDYTKNITTFELDPDIQLIITTPEMVSKYYKYYSIENYFLSTEIRDNNFEEEQPYYRQPMGLQYSVTIYNDNGKPFLRPMTQGPSIFYSKKWSLLVIDEVQKYTNATKARGRSMMAICAHTKWLLSGTMFYEPHPERILGYYILIDHPTFPRNLPDATKHIRISKNFKGFNGTMVVRERNELFTPETQPKLNKIIIDFTMSEEEEKVYLSMKSIMKKIKKKVSQLKLANQTAAVRKFSSYLLACLTYLRQIIVCPMIPLASVMLDFLYSEDKSELADIILEEMEELNLSQWMDTAENAKSTRMKKALEVLDDHKDEKIIVFTSFRTCLDVFGSFIKEREVLTIGAHMSTQVRSKVLTQFDDSSNAVLLLTYDIGAEGLNLQSAHNVIMLDVWWNSGKTKQAVARALRYGQEADTVNAYFFTSNTGLEQALFKKNDKKLDIIDELSKGNVKTTATSITMAEIMKIIESPEENKSQLATINDKIF
jgi:SNF2 family DNA or RNA helicase